MQDPTTSARIAVCDSNEIALTGLRSALAAHGLTVSATAADAGAARTLIADCRDSVVLVDVALRPAPGAAEGVIRAVRDAGGIPVAMGVDGDPETVFRALRWGAAGYLTKDLPVDAWVQAVNAALRGETLLSRTMVAALVEEFRSL